MNASEYIAEVVGHWITLRSPYENDMACEGLPSMDVKHFFATLANDPTFPQEDFSIAMVGFGQPSSELGAAAVRAGLGRVRAFADDLHVAAEWRNNREQHPRSIALASGYHSGVHTLGHYARPDSSDLATMLLLSSADSKANSEGTPDVHARLLRELATSSGLEPLRSLESCAAFLALWDDIFVEKGNQAPCFALPALGLLTDSEVFSAEHLGQRIELNMQTVNQIKQLRSSALAKLERRVNKYRDVGRREQILNSIATVRCYLFGRNGGGDLTLTQALDVVRPPADAAPEPVDNPDPGPEPAPEPPTPMSDASADALLDGKEEDLAAIADAIDSAWEDFQPNSTDGLSIFVPLPSGGEVSDNLPVARDVLDWVNAFCCEEVWGGLVETNEPKLHDALRQAADSEPLTVRPDKIVSIEGQWFSMEELLIGWDEDLQGQSPGLAGFWREFRAIRSELLPHLPKLVFHAREWLDGRPEVLAKIKRYLDLAGNLYRGIQENYRVMSGISPDWARLTLESLLALDVLQIRVFLTGGETAAKAILLPTHPLHLWRNERLSSLLRGLAQSVELAKQDRDVIHESLKRPEQFLSVIRLGSVPEGHGLGQLLPLADQVEGLPVFENLINACSGLDGAAALTEAIDQYIVIHPNHPYPLRIAVVNPPRPEALLAGFVKVLNDPRYRGGQRLSAIQVDLYASAKHRDRLQAALSFSDTRSEDLVQEKIASGRLILNIHAEQPDGLTLERIVESISTRPVHLAAVFDESTIHIRRRAAGHLLPMSPFCVRQELKLDRRTGSIAIEPQPGESPFSEFLLLMNELEGNQRDATPYAHADAESLAQTTDALLQGDSSAARWMFLADRALPHEAGMHSVKIWERREGQRDTFLAARDFTTLARLLRPVFSRCNLTVSPEAMTTLLHQGARLLGSGLLGIIKKQDGKPDEKRVLGFVGLILAARDFLRRYPGCLVLSVDHPIARLWLRTGTRMSDDRCDLLVLRKEDEKLIISAVEVKTTLGEELTDGRARIQHAKEQVAATLEAVEDGLSAAGGESQSPLSIPRCEMLKLTLARAAQVRTADPATDRENRRRWGSWLIELFHSKMETESVVELEGCVVSVLLLRANRVSDESTVTPHGKALTLRTLTEPDVGELIAPVESQPSVARQNEGPSGAEYCDASPRRQTHPIGNLEEGSPANESISPKVVPFPQLRLSQQLTTPVPPESSSVSDWPPPVNELEMIGQYEAVKRLVEQALYARETGRRFSDKLLVGPAGVGKSTLVRRIAKLLLGNDPLFFNGSTLRRPSDLTARLDQENLLPESEENGNVIVSPCLIFIDEVHGISNPVATALLSAMDDARLTTIENTLYDFRNVIFLLATTDQGKLSEAFQSRPNKTWLRPYTIHELAGIIWLHGKQALEGSELSKETCYEIAARMRCNPRRAVRDLAETLVPHFYARIHQSSGDTTSHAQVAEIMTSEAVAVFYENQGIDFNGLDNLAQRFMTYLKQQGSASEATLRQALGITQPNDFTEVAEYLVRLGLIETSPAGRRLTREGLRYLKDNPKPDLRGRISRAME